MRCKADTAAGTPVALLSPLSQKGRLIEAALQQAQPVKRDGHKQIGISKKVAAGFAHELNKERQRLVLVFEFEPHDKPPHDAGIMRRRAGALKNRRVGQGLH